MDVATVLTSVASSLGISIAAVAWLSRTLISHRLEEQRTRLGGEVKREVELALGERAAEREYEFEALKRLYTAVGPLRFQLVIACRDLATRIVSHGLERAYPFDLRYYYGRSTLYRVLRPLAIAELIERQMYYADFAVDREAIALFRFKGAAYSAFSGHTVVADHPDVDWMRQEQHVFYDQLSKAVEPLITDEGSRVMRFTEFDRLLDEENGVASIQPLPWLIGDLTVRGKPVLWLRLVAYGSLCGHVVNTAGRKIGFSPIEYPLRDLIAASGDAHLIAHLDDYVDRCGEISTL